MAVAEKQSPGFLSKDGQVLSRYKVEYARSGRSKCRTTGKDIADGELRIGKKVHGSVRNGHVLWHEQWHLPSPEFFAQHPEITCVLTELVGFDDLEEEDRNILIEQHRSAVNNSNTKPKPMTANQQLIRCYIWCDEMNTIKYRFATLTTDNEEDMWCQNVNNQWWLDCVAVRNKCNFSDIFDLYSDRNSVAQFFDNEASFFEMVDKTPKYCTAEKYRDRQMQLSPAKIFDSRDRKVGRSSLPGFEFAVHKSVCKDKDGLYDGIMTYTKDTKPKDGFAVSSPDKYARFQDWEVVDTEDSDWLDTSDADWAKNPDYLSRVRFIFGEDSKFALAVQLLETAHQERRSEAERLRKEQAVPRKRNAECSTPPDNKRPCVAAAAPVAEKQTWIVYRIQAQLFSRSPEHKRPVMTVNYVGLCSEDSPRHTQLHASFERLLPTDDYNLVSHQNEVVKRIECKENEVGYFERAEFENACDALNDYDKCYVRGSAWTQTKFGEPHRHVSPEEIRRAERNLIYNGEKAGLPFFSRA